MTIIGSVVGATIVLLLIVLLVGYCLYKRNQSRRNNNESQQRKRHQNFNVENAAYVLDLSPRRQQTPNVDDSYETIEDYAQLDNSRRIAEADNYEHLTPQDNDYTQLSELRDKSDGGQYATLNVGTERERDASSTTTPTANVNTSSSGNQNSDEPIYIELP